MITEEMLDQLEKDLSTTMSGKRYAHTVAVSKMAVRIADIYCPEYRIQMRAAGLLHDITKEKKGTEQMALCEQLDVPTCVRDTLVPKTMHAKTAAALIPTLYPAFNDDMVVNAVRWHTTGREHMTLTERIVYLADYIDDTRTFDDCVKLREMFWSVDFDKMTMDEKLHHLRRVLITSFDMTIRNLLDEGTPVSMETFSARNSLVYEEAGID